MKTAFKWFFALVVLAELIYLCSAIGMSYFTFKKYAEVDGLISISEGDSVLGYRPKSNSHSSYRFPDGSLIADIFIDDCNNRYSGYDKTEFEERFVYFGCSFMFGMNVQFDSTFSAIISRYYGAKCINTAMGGYGFGQMLLRAHEWIPKVKPKIVFFQNTDWLVDRSVTPFTSSLPVSMFNPYFELTEGRITIAPPLARNDFFELNKLQVFKKTEFTFDDLLDFSVLSANLIIKDQYRKVKRLVFFNQSGKLGKKMDVVDFVINDMIQLCKENGSTLVIVGLQNQTIPAIAKGPKPEVIYVDAERYLELHSKNQYPEVFQHYYGEPKEFFDGHPNNFAHRLIAESIISRIDSLSVIRQIE